MGIDGNEWGLMGINGYQWRLIGINKKSEGIINRH